MALCRLLEWLCKEGHYSEEELSSAMAIAKMSVDELPRCAQLAHYLPGPTMSAYELAHSGNQFTKDSSFIAPLLQSRCFSSASFCSGRHGCAEVCKSCRITLPIGWMPWLAKMGLTASDAASLRAANGYDSDAGLWLQCFCCPRRRYQDVCPSENFWGLASRGAQDEAKVHMLPDNNMYQSGVPIWLQSSAEYHQRSCG